MRRRCRAIERRGLDFPSWRKERRCHTFETDEKADYEGRLIRCFSLDGGRCLEWQNGCQIAKLVESTSRQSTYGTPRCCTHFGIMPTLVAASIAVSPFNQLIASRDFRQSCIEHVVAPGARRLAGEAFEYGSEVRLRVKAHVKRDIQH